MTLAIVRHRTVGPKSVQAGRRRAAAPLLALLLGGCSTVPSAINPVAWWHGLQGGAIAEQRPPPPGADAPYPSLGTVPAKPAPADRAQQRQIADALVADRSNAQYAAATTPLPDPSSPGTAADLFGGGANVPPPGPASTQAAPTATASLPAATAPAAVPAAPARPPAAAPRTAVAQADLPPPPATGTPGPPQGAPPVPQAPPPPPDLPGVPASAGAATLPPVAPPKPAPAPVPLAPLAVAFPAGSAVLSKAAAAPLRELAGKRAGRSVAVTGFGEAAGSDPAQQSAALSLGLARAQAIAAALAAAGVPDSAVRVNAEAVGRGGLARVLN